MSRKYPQKDDARVGHNGLFPDFNPKFKIDFKNSSVFTIGSCFARNIEEELQRKGCTLPVLDFEAPLSEWPGRPNGLLNEFNPGSISDRIIDAFNDVRHDNTELLYENHKGWFDFKLRPTPPVSFERAIQRRKEIDNIYSSIKNVECIIITLGYIEAWRHISTGKYLNSIDPKVSITDNSFEKQVLNFEEAYANLKRALQQIPSSIKVILTVSPVPLQATFTKQDCIIANEHSKSTLRVVSQMLYDEFDNVDYFPSYEIVRSNGLASYESDNIHVKKEVVGKVVQYMVSKYDSSSI